MRRKAQRAQNVLGIFGTGGHARECAWIAQACGHARENLRFVVDETFRDASETNGLAVLTLDEFSALGPAPIVIGVGDCALRRNVAARLSRAGHVFPTLVSPRALIAPNARLGAGAAIFPGVVISVDVVLGDHCHLNVNASVSHDVIVGDFSTLSPGVAICGHVRIGSGVTFGVGASVVNGRPREPIVVADDAFVAAGACVTRSVEAGMRVAGVPARTMAGRTREE
jgi:sugar O-acyltransferase (sialic acid O-acetyltransferase NeuD family)